MTKKINDFVKLIRLYPMLSTFVVSISIICTSYFQNTPSNISNIKILILAATGSMSFTVATTASNVLNQITDLTEDKITKNYRPLSKGIFSIKQALTISVFFYFLSIALSLFINIYFIIFNLLFILFTITYSTFPRIKKIFVLNQLWIGVARGFFLIIGSWSVFSHPIQNIPISLSFISCIFVFAGMSSKDIFDAEADKKTGIKTLINIIGIKKTAFFSMTLMTGSILLVMPLIFFEIFKPYHLTLLFFIIPVFYIYLQMIKPKKYKGFENASSWVIMHATNFLFIFCFAILTIIFS